MTSESLLSAAIQSLGRHESDCHPKLGVEFCEWFLGPLKNLAELKSKRARLSIDIILEECGCWYIGASTDPDAPGLNTRFKMEDGITGWVSQTNRRSPLVLNRKALLPRDTRLLPGYERTSSAFVSLIRRVGKPQAAMCYVSDEQDAVTEELQDQLRRLSMILEAFLFGGEEERLEAYSESLPQVSSYEEALAWLEARVDQIPHVWVNLWEWDSLEKHLVPKPISRFAKAVPTGFLRPLKRGEGFVGTCANEHRLIIEGRIVDNVGEGGIETPLPEIDRGIPLRSIMVAPVESDSLFFGALDVLGDTENQFHPRDGEQLAQLATRYAEILQILRRRFRRRIERDCGEDLFKSITKPDTPAEFWGRAHRVFSSLEEEGLVVSAYLFVSRRSHPELLTCKATSPAAESSLGLELKRDYPALRFIQSRGRGVVPIERLKKLPEYKGLKSLGAKRLWFDTFHFGDNGENMPDLVAAVTLPEDSVFAGVYGCSDPSENLESVISALFVTTRAVLSFSDAKSLSRQRDWMLATHNHELRQPLTSLRAEAEDLRVEDLENIERKERIIAKSEELLLRFQNMQFAATAALADDYLALKDAKQDIEVGAFLERELQKLRKDHATASIVGPERVGLEGLDVVVRGAEGWLSVALGNVVGNATKFGQRSPVIVSLGRHGSGKGGKGVCVIEVADHGIGIPVDQLDKIFVLGNKNEYSLRRVSYGMQMSLAITKDIIEQHGGRIWATSKQGQWSRFHIELPCVFKEKSKNGGGLQ